MDRNVEVVNGTLKLTTGADSELQYLETLLGALDRGGFYLGVIAE